MSEWVETTLGAIATASSGGTPPSTHDEFYRNGTIPWLNTKEVNFNRIYDTEKKITQSGLDASSAKWTPENTVVVAMYGASAGRSAIAKVRLTTNQACCNLVCDGSRADYRFVFYALKDAYVALAALANGGAQQNLNAQIIKAFKIPFPPLSIQRRIAAVLSALDDKIELNNRINANLEAQAQALFRSWFVDFEPWGGTMPEGWKTTTFGEICTARVEKGAPSAYVMYAVTNTGIHPRARIFKKHLAFANTPCKLIYKGDLVFGMSREILNWGVMKDAIGGVSSAYHVYQIDSSISSDYLESFIFSHIRDFTALIKPASREGQGFDLEKFKAMTLLVPPDSILQQYHDFIAPLTKRRALAEAETGVLASLRDALLPKLMSGEIDVSQVENPA